MPGIANFTALNSAGVCCHVAASDSKACLAAGIMSGFKANHVDALAGDVIVGAGWAAGPAPDVRHQPPGKAPLYLYTVTIVHHTIMLVA